jgi:hypothetical protein
VVTVRMSRRMSSWLGEDRSGAGAGPGGRFSSRFGKVGLVEWSGRG